MAEEWEFVSSSRRGRRRRRPKLGEETQWKVTESGAPSDLAERVAVVRGDLGRSAWWHKSIDAIRRVAPNPTKVICYGLGSIFDSRNALWQLAFTLSLADAVGASVEVGDPVLSAAEKTFLKPYCGEATPVDCLDPTGAIVYMPHCPHSLYCTLLENTPLDGLVLIGNSFQAYAARSLDRALHPAFQAALPQIHELSLDPGPRDSVLECAFNDTALIHWGPTTTPDTPVVSSDRRHSQDSL